MNILILKLGATGDVVRTTTILRCFHGNITWVTEAKNTVLFDGAVEHLRCVAWEQRYLICDRKYDLIINLEDTLEVGQFLKSLRFRALFGAYARTDGSLGYTDDSRGWFDLSLISRFGRKHADVLKLQNRRTYQDLIFGGLGLHFDGEVYHLPRATETGLTGDVAIANAAGPVWPMKNWAFYDQLKLELESRGLVVNYLPRRSTLTEHLCDVRNHRCLVGGDSLPMHLALGAGIPCVTLFTCTSPWEIYDYGLQRKIISPLLAEFFYKRGMDERATTAISVEEALEATTEQLQVPVSTAHEQFQQS